MAVKILYHLFIWGLIGAAFAWLQIEKIDYPGYITNLYSQNPTLIPEATEHYRKLLITYILVFWFVGYIFQLIKGRLFRR